MASAQRKLAIALSRLPPHPCKDASLEQYATEGDFAARWLTAIVEVGDLENGIQVVDLAAGNGILGIGAVLLGAGSATLVELDSNALDAARNGVSSLGLSDSVECVQADVTDWLQWPEERECGLVVMNPPWGYQSKGADRPFIEAALASPANAIHLLHAGDATHPPAMAREAGWSAEVLLEGEFRIPATYAHHLSRERSTSVKCWRFTR